MASSRRHRAKPWTLLPLLALGGGAPWAQATAQVPGDTATGIVFEDSNRNGTREAGEPGIAGVAVSNGAEVVQSDADGRYSLPVADGTILFVTKPAGYAPPLGPDNLPRFYYIHAPDGTPTELGLRYRGLEPTGPLPASVDFALVRVEEPEDFTVLWLADPQPQTPAELDYLRDSIIAELVDTQAAFAVVAGDLVYDDLSLFPRLNALMGALGPPWYPLPGNHDVNYLAPDDRWSLETYKRHYGPPYYSFDYGRVHFVLLDDVVYHGRPKTDANPWGAGTYEGRIDETQLAWLARDLSLVPQDRLVVVAMHVQLYGSDAPVSSVANREALLKLLSGRRHVLSIAGHLHGVLHSYFGAADGFEGPGLLHQHVLAAAAGGWWSGPLDARGLPLALGPDGTPKGYYLMRVHGNEASLRFKAAGGPADEQMRITLAPFFEHPSLGPAAPADFHEPPIPQARLEAIEVVVNLYDGGPNSTVEFRIDGGPPIAMMRSPRADPLFTRLSLRFDDRNEFWTPGRESQHVWAASLPRGLAPGVHRLVVRALDEYGQLHEASKLFEVAP